MSNTDASVEAEEALFDVVVRISSTTRLSDVEHKAAEAGIAPEKIEPLIKALRSVPQIKIGSAVNRERADKAKEQFTKAGLIVEITPLLALSTMTAGSMDGTSICPACTTRVMLPESRQCPHCGVYVDKVTDDVQLRRKLMDKERAVLEAQADLGAKKTEAANKEAIEKALRHSIRKELEKKYGKPKTGTFEGKAGAAKLAGIGLLVAAAFFGGRSGAIDRLFNKKESAPVATADMNKLAAAQNGGAPTGDADLDDPLLQAAGGKRVGAKGISLEQAVAAAQGLTPGGAGKAGAPGAAGEGAPVSDEMKSRLSLDFARQLAEMGQLPRANGLIASLKAKGADAGAVRVTELEVRAWGTLSAADGRKAAEGLMAAAAALTDPAERTLALTRIAAVLSRNPQLPTDVARGFLAQAAESLKLVTDGNKANAAASEWTVVLGESMMMDASARARSGSWAKARSAGQQLVDLIKQAPDAAAQMRLYAYDYQVQQLLGHEDKATEALDAALVLAGKTNNLAEQAAQVRVVAKFSNGAAHPRMQAVMTAIQNQASAKSGMERAMSLASLSLINAEAGSRARSTELGQMAQATPGLSATDATAVNTELIVRGDLATAKVLHASGMYAESEAVLQRLGDYLI